MQTLLSIFTYLIDTVFPRECVGCGERSTILCENCMSRIPKAEQPAHSFITAIFDYRNPTIREVIWKFKYKNAQVLAKYFGEKLYEEILGELGDDLNVLGNEAFLLVPVPLHKKRLRERGYNQSELLAREIIKYDTAKIFQLASEVLTRTRATKPQAKSEKRAARFETLRGAFVTNSALVRGKHIILIDDVTTTGATLSEAHKTLLRAGALTVRAYAVAH
ncbi:MAG: hypothetical protein A3D51_00465 [Candidatus Yonathbacteria bacterium RIFCSPHIGHO2_02_FULL_44_14]|uniref:Phosphoribosyltransferase domain-containing protein n=1 Tax=Candidatus Yonathbacteria bacterium RIFCSPHIGHO2_02_FULL_44_14 TaxID=1802724 RepID=A0A1G2S764_9BACT|nr:MAG: hypothetical protein A3D51_00465 [Candidatus Yonathbacteria bacterium RIFCSPHIGHO2_02_FULL_44_14]